MGALRTGRPLFTLRALRAGGTLRTGRAVCTVRARFTLWALGTHGTLIALRTFGARCAVRSGFTLRALGARGTGGAGFASGTGGAYDGGEVVVNAAGLA